MPARSTLKRTQYSRIFLASNALFCYTIFTYMYGLDGDGAVFKLIGRKYSF